MFHCSASSSQAKSHIQKCPKPTNGDFMFADLAFVIKTRSFFHFPGGDLLIKSFADISLFNESFQSKVGTILLYRKRTNVRGTLVLSFEYFHESFSLSCLNVVLLRFSFLAGLFLPLSTPETFLGSFLNVTGVSIPAPVGLIERLKKNVFPNLVVTLLGT